MVVNNMTELPFPFRYRPDVMLIELPEYSAKLDLRSSNSPSGLADEILCYWDGILFGQVTAVNVRFAKLLPTLDRRRNFPWPSADTYASTIATILTQFRELEVWCERDCDQYALPLINTVDDLLGQLQLVQEFCLEGRIECPSFSYRPSSARSA